MEKKEIVELSSFKNRKATNGMSKSITEIKLKLESKNGAKIPLFPWYIKKNGLLN